jgi:hypothetical protein
VRICPPLGPMEQPWPQGCDDPDAGAVLCFDFTIPSVDLEVLDRSGNGNHGTWVGAPMRVGTPLDFGAQLDGTNYIQVPDSPELNLQFPSTIDAWIRVDAYPAPGARVTVLDDQAEYGLFLFSDGAVNCSYARIADGLEVTAGHVPLNVFTHLACRATESSLDLFVDGVLVATESGPYQIERPLPDPLLLGANSPQGNDRFVGVIDEVRIFAAAPSDAQICHLVHR